MEDCNETRLNYLNGDKFYCPDYNFICREADSNWKYIKNSADIASSPRQTMMGLFWGERAVWGGSKVKFPPLITTGIRFCVFCDESCIQGTKRLVLTWLNIHLNSYLLLQYFILNFFIFCVYMVILLFEQLKTGTNWKLLTRQKKSCCLHWVILTFFYLKNH